jgi:hypothetical protein
MTDISERLVAMRIVRDKVYLWERILAIEYVIREQRGK